MCAHFGRQIRICHAVCDGALGNPLVASRLGPLLGGLASGARNLASKLPNGLKIALKNSGSKGASNPKPSGGKPGSGRGSVGDDFESGLNDMFSGGKTPTAKDLKNFADSQGFTPKQTPGGPLKFVDQNGIVRITIKQGSSRAPGSNFPHAEFRNSAGQRIDPFGNLVTRRSPGNHTPIDLGGG